MLLFRTSNTSKNPENKISKIDYKKCFLSTKSEVFENNKKINMISEGSH